MSNLITTNSSSHFEYSPGALVNLNPKVMQGPRPPYSGKTAHCVTKINHSIPSDRPPLTPGTASIPTPATSALTTHLAPPDPSWPWPPRLTWSFRTLPGPGHQGLHERFNSDPQGTRPNYLATTGKLKTSKITPATTGHLLIN